MIRPARIERHEGNCARFGAHGGHCASRQNKALRREKNDSGIAAMLMPRSIGMVVIGGGVRFLAMRMRARAMDVLVCVGMLLRTTVSQAIADVSGERIGEMGMMMRVVQAVHQRNVGLPRQHERQRHAEHGDSTAKQDKTLPMQRKASLRPECGLNRNLA